MTRNRTAEMFPIGNISEAAHWLASTPDPSKPHPVIPYLQKAYNLTPAEAIQAIRKSNEIKAKAA